jgi:ribosomal protein L5
MAETAYTPRLRTEYDKQIRGKLTEQFGYANVMQVPRLDKVVLNMGRPVADCRPEGDRDLFAYRHRDLQAS